MSLPGEGVCFFFSLRKMGPVGWFWARSFVKPCQGHRGMYVLRWEGNGQCSDPREWQGCSAVGFLSACVWHMGVLGQVCWALLIQPLLKAWINTFNPPNVSLRWIVLSGPHLQIEEMKVRTLTKSSTKMGSSGVTSPKSDLDSRGHTCHQIQRGLKYWVPSCWSGYLDCKLQSQTKKCVCVF